MSRSLSRLGACVAFACAAAELVHGLQETDVTQAPNAANAGIKKSLQQQIGAGRGNPHSPGSSAYLIARDPFRAIARGRQLFQRKFTEAQGNGPRTGDGVGPIETDGSVGAGLADSCAACHGRPQGSAGFGGDVFTRTTSRDAPHLFGLGLQEMLADEMTAELRAQRDEALAQAFAQSASVTVRLTAKGIDYGALTAFPDGSLDTSLVDGVNPDLRVRPFFAQGGTISIREFLVGAFNAEMGLEAFDPDLAAAVAGGKVVTPSGMTLDGALDAIEAAPAAHALADPDGDGVVDEIPQSLVDVMEFYLLNYFKPGLRTEIQALAVNATIGEEPGGAGGAGRGRALFHEIGCATCHVPQLTIENDRRVADVETRLDEQRGNPFNNLFATAKPLFEEIDDGTGLPSLKVPKGGPFVVRNFFADMKRHDIGSAFWEKNFDGSLQKEFMTEPLWGVGSTSPYGHDGRSPTLEDVILRHGGEAQAARDAFDELGPTKRDAVVEFLETLVLFSPPSTASTLDEKDTNAPDYPVNGHGSIKLSVLFNDPFDPE